jgi:hypothetical protein
LIRLFEINENNMAASFTVDTSISMFRGWHLVDEPTMCPLAAFEKALAVEANEKGGVWLIDSVVIAQRYCRQRTYAGGEYTAKRTMNIISLKTVNDIEAFVDSYKSRHVEYLNGETGIECVSSTRYQVITNMIASMRNNFTPDYHGDHVFRKFFTKCVQDGDRFKDRDLCIDGFLRTSFAASLGADVDEYYIISKNLLVLSSWKHTKDRPYS